MAGIATPNLPTYFIDSAIITARAIELPDADFDDGVNRGGSNAGVIGINTGDYSPKDTDWPEIEQLSESQYIGEDISGVFCIDATFGDDALAGFGPADGVTAADAVLTVDVAGSGFNTVNRTGDEVPSGAWTWGAINNP